jgi:hypothetical protein
MKQTLNEQLSRIKQMMNAVSPILNEDVNVDGCFNYEYITTIVKKNGLITGGDYLETPFTPASDQSNLDRNKQLGLTKNSKMEPFVIRDPKNDLMLDLFETDPAVSLFIEVPEARGTAINAGNLAETKGFRVDYDSTNVHIYVDDKEGQTVECGNYEVIMRRIGRFAQLMKLLGPNFKLAYMTSTGE